MSKVLAAMRRSPVTAILGPRQCGKTTLAWMVEKASGRHATFFDLEDPAHLESLAEPMSVLRPLKGLVVIDEIQRRPDLFPILRVLADRRPTRARFLILGSASPELLRQGSESLAGRLELVEMAGFGLSEVGPEKEQRLWLRGGFPPSFLARGGEASAAWRESLIRTFLERDLSQLGFNLPALTLRRFWTMVAHSHGQIWNSSDIGRSLGVSDVTARRYLDILAGAYMVRQLPPWFENLGKRQVKSPKVYVRDTGILHGLLRLWTFQDLLRHPKCGASWEGFATEEVLRLLPTRDVYFWATHGEAELDLLVFHRGKRWGFEFKFKDAPKPTRSMQIALQDLRLDRLWVVYPGTLRYALTDRITALPLREIGGLTFGPA